MTAASTDHLKFVASANVMRRHLSSGERADAAAAIETLRQGRPEKDAPVHVFRAEAAELFGVSERIVADASLDAIAAISTMLIEECCRSDAEAIAKIFAISASTLLSWSNVRPVPGRYWCCRYT